MNACAYFENGTCVETMEAHIRRGLDIIEGLYLRRGYASFLSRVLNVDPKLAGEVLKKTHIIHDVGKCLEGFQKRREKFRFHEFYSALVAGEVFGKYGGVGDVMSVAILLHHHDWVRYRSPEKPKNLELCNDCLSVLEELSGERLPRELPWKKWNEFMQEAEEVMRRNLKGVYSLLLPLVVADNYAAALNRGGTGSTLGREIFEVLNVRGWDVARGLSGGL
ncbi:hydrolase [Thermococcus profundus]|uniref:Hydrolase n=1 Tax=Thermococcus profundus TaxID=49899 RepID=A0A2Z2MDR2_THEPR|nr:CRISPR-associated endonuclease Cas3'' [Thermococcus profundus]ASJ02832.1 hydrolase [Thermococcus profundus]